MVYRPVLVVFGSVGRGGEGAVRATSVLPTYLLSPCVPPPLRLHRVPCVRRGSQVTPASYTEPVVKLCMGGVGVGLGVGGQHIQAIRKTNSSKREATLKPSSECSFVCTTTASIWSQLPLNLCSEPPPPPQCQWGHSASRVGLHGAALARGFWPGAIFANLPLTDRQS